MNMGGPGDHPLTDLLNHGLHPFPPDMERTLRHILLLDRNFPDGRRPYVEQERWSQRFIDWEQGKNLDEGREAMRQVLEEIRAATDKRRS